MTPQLIIRMANVKEVESELALLEDFYQSFPTGFVKRRKDGVLENVIEDEKMVMGFDQQGNLAAVTGEFEHNNQEHIEIGGVLVSPDIGGFNWRGFGLQKIMMSIQRAGFRQVKNLNDLKIETVDLESDNPEKVYYLYDSKQNMNVATMLKNICQNKLVEKNGRKIKIELNIPYINKGYLDDFV